MAENNAENAENTDKAWRVEKNCGKEALRSHCGKYIEKRCGCGGFRECGKDAEDENI